MRPNTSAAPAAIVLAAIAMLAAGCGDDDDDGDGAAPATGAPSAAEPAGSTTTPSGGDGEDSGERHTGAGGPRGAGVAGSNGGSDGGAASAEAGAPTVEAAIEAVLTGAGTPEQACATYITERFLQRAYGGRANCLAARRPDALARSVEITPSFVNERGAHAVVVPAGGPYDGAKVEIEVVPASGFGGAPYRVDSLTANVPAGP